MNFIFSCVLHPILVILETFVTLLLLLVLLDFHDDFSYTVEPFVASTPETIFNTTQFVLNALAGHDGDEACLYLFPLISRGSINSLGLG